MHHPSSVTCVFQWLALAMIIPSVTGASCLPDLAVRWRGYTVDGPEVCVRNRGNAASPPTQVSESFGCGTSFRKLLDVPGLNPDEVYCSAFSPTRDGRSTVAVDVSNAIEESDESNNGYCDITGGGATPTPTRTGTQLSRTPTPTRTVTPTRSGASACLTSTPRPTELPPRSPSASATPRASSTPTTVPAACTGDCDQDGRVTVDEILVGIELFLSTERVVPCGAYPVGESGNIEIAQLVTAVHHALMGCAVREQSTPTPNACPTRPACPVCFGPSCVLLENDCIECRCERLPPGPTCTPRVSTCEPPMRRACHTECSAYDCSACRCELPPTPTP